MEIFSRLILFALLPFGLYTAVSLPGEIATIEVGDKSAFVSWVNTVTSEMGYSSPIQTEDVFTYEPLASWKLFWRRGTILFPWPISVHVHGNQAVIIGPRRYVGRLQKRLAEA